MSRADHGHGRRHKGTQEGLEDHDHTESKLPADRHIDTEDEDGIIGKQRDKRREHAEDALQSGKLDGLGIYGGLISRPLCEIPVFRTAGFDGLYHLDAVDGGRRQLSFIPGLDAGDIDAL